MSEMATKETFDINPYTKGIKLSSGKEISAEDLTEIRDILSTFDGYSMLAYHVENNDFDFDLPDILANINKDNIKNFCHDLNEKFEDTIHSDTGETEFIVTRDKLEIFLRQQEIEWLNKEEDIEDVER